MVGLINVQDYSKFGGPLSDGIIVKYFAVYFVAYHWQHERDKKPITVNS